MRETAKARQNEWTNEDNNNNNNNRNRIHQMYVEKLQVTKKTHATATRQKKWRRSSDDNDENNNSNGNDDDVGTNAQKVMRTLTNVDANRFQWLLVS